MRYGIAMSALAGALLMAAASPAQQPLPRVVTLLPTDARIVGYMAVETGDSVAGAERVALQFDSLLRVSLESRGFAVLDRWPAQEAWLRARDSLGGFYDRRTGARLEPNVAAAARAALVAGGAELLLAPELVPVDIWIAGRKARWDGVERSTEGVVGGRTLGLTLAAELRDTSGVRAAALRSGFNMMTKPKGGDLVRRSRAELFEVKRMRECTDRLADSMPGVPRRPPTPPPAERRPIP